MILDTAYNVINIIQKKTLYFSTVLKADTKRIDTKRRHGDDVEMEGVIAQESCRYRIKAVCRINKFVAWRVQKQDK